jgi:hypothetical protein
VKQNPVLILMAYFMVVVGILDVAVQRLYVKQNPVFNIDGVFYGRCWYFRRCSATPLRETKPCFNIDGVFYGRCWHFIFRRCSATSLPN